MIEFSDSSSGQTEVPGDAEECVQEGKLGYVQCMEVERDQVPIQAALQRYCVNLSNFHNSPNLSFPTCKMGTITLPAARFNDKAAKECLGHSCRLVAPCSMPLCWEVF